MNKTLEGVSCIFACAWLILVEGFNTAATHAWWMRLSKGNTTKSIKCREKGGEPTKSPTYPW